MLCFFQLSSIETDESSIVNVAVKQVASADTILVTILKLKSFKRLGQYYIFTGWHSIDLIGVKWHKNDKIQYLDLEDTNLFVCKHSCNLDCKN